MRKFKKLQNFKEELQKNVSLQLMYNMDICKKIRNISTTLQELATKLCYELYRREPGNPIFIFNLLLDNELNLGVT